MLKFLLLCLITLSALGQTHPEGYVIPLGATAMSPTGTPKYIQANSGGRLLTGGLGALPQIGGPSGYVPPYVMVGQDPTGKLVYMQVDVNGNLLTSGSGSTPPGSDTQVIFNDGGAFGAASGLTYNKSIGTVAIGATVLKQGGPGVINVRLQYGAVPDGSTDNSTAITNAFTAANAFTTGTATVRFDCDTNSNTTCQFNYGGSSTSPINPTVPMTVECAPGVRLNYTGSAHAVDVGPSGLVLSTAHVLPYTIQGCTFTGAASSTQGIYINAYITDSRILNNQFVNFGNLTGYNIAYTSNNWESLVMGNNWHDTDGTTRNMMDAHTGASIRIIGNNVECETNTNTACSVSPIGVGFWIGSQSKVIGNVIQYHAPLIRIPSAAGYATSDRPTISANHFEGNSGVAVPAITYGDPGGIGNVQISCMEFSGNDMFYPVGTGVPIIGPETPASSQYYLSNCVFDNNSWSTPSSGTFFVNTNGGARNIWGRNQSAGTILNAATASPAVFDLNSSQFFRPLTAPANQYLLQVADGTGSLSAATLKLNNNVLYPTSDSTTAFTIAKANGTTGVVVVDTTNGFLTLNVQAAGTSFILNGANGEHNYAQIKANSAGARAVWEYTNTSVFNMFAGLNGDGSFFIDTNSSAASGHAVSFSQSGIPTVQALKSTTGTRYLCIDSSGVVSSSASACSGT